ncbi:MAG: SOS response-associated peptidase [Alphaproteobacteria bacterium]|nr:SOS response-associated peptidase [Alphaproteobacteria bacterium]MDE2111633.1 SOS response-associated peptidase [Alphaproteobacteria bacterium]MDE2494241.1 SOS response-associated peptidase [Alphaproteobacteria bacterium]
MMATGTAVRLSELVGSTASAQDDTVTPMRFANVITLNRAKQRKAVRMRWGLVPPGAKDPTAGRPHIHARAETVDTKPTFREAFRYRRGLIAVSTFNEGKEITPTRTEQYVLTPQDGGPIAIAVIWERWREPNEMPLLSFAMVTVPANPLIATITERMPALLADDGWAKWLGEEPATIDELKALLHTSGRGLDLRRAGKPPSKPKRNGDQPTLL